MKTKKKMDKIQPYLNAAGYTILSVFSEAIRSGGMLTILAINKDGKTVVIKCFNHEPEMRQEVAMSCLMGLSPKIATLDEGAPYHCYTMPMMENHGVVKDYETIYEALRALWDRTRDKMNILFPGLNLGGLWQWDVGNGNIILTPDGPCVLDGGHGAQFLEIPPTIDKVKSSYNQPGCWEGAKLSADQVKRIISKYGA